MSVEFDEVTDAYKSITEVKIGQNILIKETANNNIYYGRIIDKIIIKPLNDGSNLYGTTTIKVVLDSGASFACTKLGSYLLSANRFVDVQVWAVNSDYEAFYKLNFLRKGDKIGKESN